MEAATEKLSGLYLVATPIGNLEDITLRALRVLKSVDLVAAEDTRHTRQLLSRFDIHVPLESCHAFNEHQKVGKLVEKIASGMSVALVSDAGTPSVADPGYLLVNAALEGASELLLCRPLRESCEERAKRCELVELASDGFFADEYIDKMGFEK